MNSNPTPDRPVNDMRELYAVQHAITDAGGTLTPGVHKAIDALREVWDAGLRQAQAEGHQYRTALQGVARRDAAVPSVSAVDQTTRDRIAAAIWERQNPGRRWADCEYRWRADAEADADAVLAVLPPPADRGAVLREAADAVFALDYDVMVGEVGDENFGSMREAWDVGTIHATNLLRRLADEAQQPAVGARQPDTETPGCPDPIECSHEAALGEAQARLQLLLGVAEVIEANGVAWAADSVRRAVNDDLSQPAAVPAAGAGQDETQEGDRG